jgi:hypothetical protein
MIGSKLEERLNSLKAEHESGQKMLAELDAKRRQISDTLLRIEGALMVLKELIEEGNEKQMNGSAVAPGAEGPSAAARS